MHCTSLKAVKYDHSLGSRIVWEVKYDHSLGSRMTFWLCHFWRRSTKAIATTITISGFSLNPCEFM